MAARPPQRSAEGFKRGLVWSGLNCLLGLLLILAALLRENPMFWRNAGGYPIFLRDLVEILFYPALLGYFLGTAAVSLIAVRLLVARFRVGGALLFAGLVQWFLLAVILTIVLWNNVDNLLHGQPLHYHPPV